MKDKPSNPLWGGRFKQPVDSFVKQFTASEGFDRLLYKQDIQGSIAHCKMLAQQKIISTSEADAIQQGLLEIEKNIETGDFKWSVELEDVHMNIEAALIDLIGECGKKLHTGRSRNDQVALDIRLWLRQEINDIMQLLSQLQQGIITLALEHAGTIMPGYTHLQAAQPVTFGHHLLAWNEMLQRDYQRFVDCRRRMNQSPLGSGALAGTSFPIDRHLTAELLGFESPTTNSLDSVSDRDFAIEFCGHASICMVHLSRMSEELVFWTSSNIHFIELPDRFCTGSSIMPQKKNPDVPELVRGKSGRVIGNLNALLVLMKAQPLAYNKDNQEDKEPIFDTAKTIKDCLRAFSEMIPHIVPQQENMRAAANSGYSTATDLADYLVSKGISFRDAHEIVGKVVGFAIANHYKLEKIPLVDLQQFSQCITEDVFEVLSVDGSVVARNHFGGTAPEQVKKAGQQAFERVKQRSINS